jgi:hypothetical protein
MSFDFKEAREILSEAINTLSDHKDAADFDGDEANALWSTINDSVPWLLRLAEMLDKEIKDRT